MNVQHVATFDDTIAAAFRARAGVRDAQAQLADMPRAFGRGDALQAVRNHLDCSASTLERFAESARSIDAALGATFVELADRIRTAAPLADARTGASLLRTRLDGLDATLSSALDRVRVARTDARFPTAEAADERLRELAAAGPAAMTRQTWFELADIARLTGERRPQLMDDRFRSHAEFAGQLVDRGVDPMVNEAVTNTLNAWRAPLAFPDRAATTERLRELARVPATELTRSDLFDLHAMSKLPEDLRPELLGAVPLDDALHAARTDGRLRKASDTAARLRGIEATNVWTTREDAIRETLATIGAGPSEMTADRMELLASLSELPPTHNPGISKFERLRAVAEQLRSHRNLEALERSGYRESYDDRLVRNWINLVRAPYAWPTREAATSRLQDIAFAWHEHGTLSAIEADDLHALARLRDELRPTALARHDHFIPPAYTQVDEHLRTLDSVTINAWARGGA